MLTPCRCLTCGYPIGRVAALFRLIRAKRVKAYLKDRQVLPTQTLVDAQLHIDMSDVFDRLGIPKDPDCCRTHLATAMDMREYY